MLEGSDYLKLGLLVLFLALSAFFSGSETAFIALQRVRLIHMVRTGVPGARQIFRMAQHPERLLATVLLGNNLVNTAAAALSTALVISLLDNVNSAILIATGGVTLLLLIFGEIVPKTLAARHSERFAFAVVRPLQLVEWLLFPLVRSLQGLSSVIARITGAAGQPSLVTEQEIRSLISVGKEAGAVEASEAEMLEKVFHFGDLQVAEIMTPRRHSGQCDWAPFGERCGQSPGGGKPSEG
jgi:Mg2+/Co2+ transporter CorB